jgi:hypothetical protein
MYDFIINAQSQVQEIFFNQPWDAFLPQLVGFFIAIATYMVITGRGIKYES